MDKTQPIRLKHFHENDGGRAKYGTQCKQCGMECTYSYAPHDQNDKHNRFNALYDCDD